MNRVVTVVSLGLMLACAGRAAAWDREVAQFHISAGVTAKASPHEYSSRARWANTPHIFGVGASIRLQRFLSATIDVDHTQFGAGMAPGAWAPEMTPFVDPSSMTTALAGLELKPPTEDGRGPYVSAALGAGNLSIGALRVEDMNGGSTYYPAIRSMGPAFALGAGIRSPRLLGGFGLRLGMRSVSMLKGSHWLGIIPFTASVVY